MLQKVAVQTFALLCIAPSVKKASCNRSKYVTTDFLIKLLGILQEVVVAFFEFLQSGANNNNNNNNIK